MAGNFSKSETDDYSLTRVPREKRSQMWKILLIRIGSLTCISQLMLGAALGFGLSFWKAFWATIIGSVILQFVSFGLGVAGEKEGLSTSVLSRWTGFGRYGSAIVGGAFAISLTGWFGIQNSIFAQGIIAILGKNLSFPLIACITGVAVTLIVLFGFRMMSWTANIAVPGFLILIAWATYSMLKSHSFTHLVTMNAPGALTMSAAITMVTGGFIVGCIITPDITRFAKSTKDVFWITVIGTLLGELGIGLLGVLMAHAIGSSSIMAIVYQLTGVLGVLLVIFSTLKLNDINLYSSSLGIANFIEAVFHVDVSRGLITIILGALGTILSMIGVINQFTSFLSLLGVVFPPIAGIMFIDYFVLRRYRNELDESRKHAALPARMENFHPVTVIAWAAGVLSGYFITFGIPSITSILISIIVYYAGMKIYAAVKVHNDVEQIHE
ncbi:cytosine permease [Sporolactobacillus sp. CQH2019]|uniref:purine-cytosine permease family protein n=1 Tax=Sporolactobacillus sp. CQH2019 TaxID=3023512 RepID=UPI002367F115|nr:cytosine permease [Sporolactobacillus sp. CQH2019]MDD9148896.1 cytosine permease [Sporolactobacillus sp. CQH2019]